jgi:hypothetical protein
MFIKGSCRVAGNPGATNKQLLQAILNQALSG